MTLLLYQSKAQSVGGQSVLLCFRHSDATVTQKQEKLRLVLDLLDDVQRNSVLRPTAKGP